RYSWAVVLIRLVRVGIVKHHGIETIRRTLHIQGFFSLTFPHKVAFHERKQPGSWFKLLIAHSNSKGSQSLLDCQVNKLEKYCFISQLFSTTRILQIVQL